MSERNVMVLAREREMVGRIVMASETLGVTSSKDDRATTARFALSGPGERCDDGCKAGRRQRALSDRADCNDQQQYY